MRSLQAELARPQPRWRRIWWRHPELSLIAVGAVAWLALAALHLTTGPAHGGVQTAPAAGHHGGIQTALVAGHHGGTPDLAGGHAVAATHWTPNLAVAVGLWALMIVAMMLPAISLEARQISLDGRWSRRQRGAALFALGYLAVWFGVGVVVLSALRLAGPAVGGPVVVAAALLVAAVWETTQCKRRFLLACHRIRALPPAGWAADKATVREGVRNGMNCTGSCGPLMIPMALVPHSAGLFLMMLLAAVITAQKVLARAENHLRLSAAVLAVAAAAAVCGALT